MLKAARPLRASGAQRAIACPRSRVAPVRAALVPADVLYTLAEEVVKAGDVNAPIGVAIGGAIVVAIAGTLLVPLALKPGDDAAKDIFAGKNLGKSTVKKPKAGSKAASK